MFSNYLFLSSNSLTGVIPECLGNLNKMEVLLLGNNEFIGTIPESIGMMEDLSFLDMSNNHITGSIPESIGELSQLNYLHLNANILTDEIPGNICDLNINWSNPTVSSLSDNFFCLQPYPDCLEEYVGDQSCDWYIQGDSNLNGTVDILDVIMLVEFILGTEFPDPFQFIVSDIHPNDRLDILDIEYQVDLILL